MKAIKVIQQASSWKDLNKTLKKLILKNQTRYAGEIFEYLVKYYLQVAPQYKTKLKYAYLLKEVPNNIKKKINLPNADEGIDIIAETFDNEYWAIQCKFRSDNSETLKVKGDLSTFNNLAFTVCKNISHGIVCATVNRPPKKTKLLNSVGFELLTTWLGLDRDNGQLFKEIKSKSVGKIEKPKKLSPRPHQKQAIVKTISYLKNNERGKMIMPCGTGKSLTAFWIAEKMRPKSILIAVPSLALLQQTLKVWTREFLLNNIQPDWLCVCSDDTVKEEQDDFVTFSADLGIKVDTDPRVIRNFLRKKTPKIKIVFTTYQSGKATAIGSKGFNYDLGIMDEAHKTVGSGSKPMAHLLHQKNIKIKKRLFMTATERLFKGDKDEYMSMDDPRDYGNLIYELSFKEAINSKPPIISDYKVITFGITNPEIEEITQTNKYLEVKKELKDITARELATAIALRKAIKKLKIKNAISFHRSIKRAENFRKQQDLITKIYPTYGKLKTFHVRGDMPTSDRALEMLAFEEDKGLMTNARCLTEGVDLPAIDCVCFTDPKRSKVDIVQAAGRALRLSKGKKFGYILIPIFIPDGVDFNEAAEQQGFDDVSITVRALATSDKRIVEYLRAVSEGKKPTGGSPVEGVTSINNLYKVEAEEFDNAVKLKVWDKVALGNWRTYEEAKLFAQKMKLSSVKAWFIFAASKNFPSDIPKSPHILYRKSNQWEDWEKFLGGNVKSQKIKYIKYKEAVKYLKKFKLKNNKQFHELRRTGKIPNFIPVRPYIVYKDEFINMDIFLSKKKISPQNMSWISYDQAKTLIKKFKIKSVKQWQKIYKLKKLYNFKIPANPQAVYSSNWKGYGDFFGTKIISNRDKKKYYLGFKEVKNFVKKNKIQSKSEWYKVKLPYNIPRSVSKIYKKDWVSWHNFFNRDTKQIKKSYIEFYLAKKILKKNGIKQQSEYFKFIKTNQTYNFPSNPQIYYKNKKLWKGWPDFFSRNYLREPIDFYEFKKLTNKYNINSYNDYRKLRKKLYKNNVLIPADPKTYYKLKSAYEIFDPNKLVQFLNFKECKNLIKKIRIKNSTEFYQRYKNENFRKLGIPYSPAKVYKDEWKGWHDFCNKSYYEYSEAKKILKKFNFKGSLDFEGNFNFDKFPNMHKAPSWYYRSKKQWKGWPDFLGKV